MTPRAQQVLEFLGQIREGDFVEELAEELEKAVNAQHATGKGASVSVKIALTPASSQHGSNRHFVRATTSASLPALEVESDMFFTGGETLFSRRDPRQAELFGLRDVNAEIPSREAANE